MTTQDPTLANGFYWTSDQYGQLTVREYRFPRGWCGPPPARLLARIIEPVVGIPGDLPGALPLARVVMTGVLHSMGATIWVRQDALAESDTPVPWSTQIKYPWVVEIHWRSFATGSNLDLEKRVVRWPSSVDPRTPSRNGDMAIAACCQRALSGEVVSGLFADGDLIGEPEAGDPYTLMVTLYEHLSDLLRRLGEASSIHIGVPGTLDTAHVFALVEGLGGGRAPTIH